MYLVNHGYGDDIEKAETVNIQEFVDELLFVSRGSTCDVGHALRASNLHKVFNFDQKMD